MPANIGRMFWYGKEPWHHEGKEVDHPLNLSEAMTLGGLDWEVDMIPLRTNEEPSSPVSTRMAVVRADRPPGDVDRVVGIAHNNFVPLQNRDGARIFDEIFGRGRAVYHTGGYLGKGERIWLLAELPRKFDVGTRDRVLPYALFSNSHDGSQAIDFRLTAVRVVCQNTLSLALRKGKPQEFLHRRHDGRYELLEEDAKEFFAEVMEFLQDLEKNFKSLYEKQWPTELTEQLLSAVLPIPPRPLRAKIDSAQIKAWETRVRKARERHNHVLSLLKDGKGSEIPGVRGSAWGMLNAVLEFIDHHMDDSESGMIAGLFGQRAELKRKAYDLVRAAVSAS